MEQLRKHLIKGKTIAFMAIAAILINMLLPVHYHFHHNDTHNTTHHSHSIDLHSAADDSHHDEATNVFDATPQGMSKLSIKHFSPLFLFTFILLLLPFVDKRVFIGFRHHYLMLTQNHFAIAPPLRAPPR